MKITLIIVRTADADDVDVRMKKKKDRFIEKPIRIIMNESGRRTALGTAKLISKFLKKKGIYHQGQAKDR